MEHRSQTWQNYYCLLTHSALVYSIMLLFVHKLKSWSLLLRWGTGLFRHAVSRDQSQQTGPGLLIRLSISECKGSKETGATTETDGEERFWDNIKYVNNVFYVYNYTFGRLVIVKRLSVHYVCLFLNWTHDLLPGPVLDSWRPIAPLKFSFIKVLHVFHTL